MTLAIYHTSARMTDSFSNDKRITAIMVFRDLLTTDGHQKTEVNRNKIRDDILRELDFHAKRGGYRLDFDSCAIFRLGTADSAKSSFMVSLAEQMHRLQNRQPITYEDPSQEPLVLACEWSPFEAP